MAFGGKGLPPYSDAVGRDSHPAVIARDSAQVGYRRQNVAPTAEVVASMRRANINPA